MAKVFLFGHGGSGNRGCEAIVRGTVKILKHSLGDTNIQVASNRAGEDKISKVADIDGVEIVKSYKKYTPVWFASIFAMRVLRQKATLQPLHKAVINFAKNSDVCLSIGGDNYCYGHPKHLFYINKEIKRLNKKLVLWGASVEPDAIDGQMAEDLKSYDLKIVRESITYHAFMEKGITENAYLHSDPAFTMECQEIPLPNGWEDGGMVGINISPLIVRYGEEDSVVQAVSALMRHIIDKTPFKICLIPHVTWSINNDYEYMKRFYNEFMGTGRVLLLEANYNAPQTKYIISKCKMLIAARTHASIAGYSTCVPTLVIGYSVKSRGIARDIFGTEQDFVLPVQSLNSREDLVKSFEKLRERESELRNYLNQKMPSYIDNAWSAGNRIKVLMK